MNEDDLPDFDTNKALINIAAELLSGLFQALKAQGLTDYQAALLASVYSVHVGGASNGS